MARPTDEYVIDRFFDAFADMSAADRAGVITGLRATHRSMLRVRPDTPVAEPQGSLATEDEPMSQQLVIDAADLEPVVSSTAARAG